MATQTLTPPSNGKTETKAESKLSSFFSDNQSQAFAKIGMYGPAGTGKSYNAARLAIGIVKKYGLTKPVVFFDTEHGSNFLRGLFQNEGIAFNVKKSRTFKDLVEAVAIAEKEASVLIVDSISHVWRELTSAYLNQFNKERYERLISRVGADRAKAEYKPAIQLEFQHWGVIKPRWAKFTDAFLNSQLHMIVCGRAGDIYDYQENENGKKELIKSGSRMATEKELSYEPSLLIELMRKNVNGEESLVALIEKDRSDTINGKEFKYLKFEDIAPHMDFLAVGTAQKTADFYKNESSNLFENQTLNAEDEWHVEKRKRAELVEEIKGTMYLKYPGMDAESKKIRLELLQKHFNTVSETKLEGTSSEVLRNGLKNLREEIKNL